MKSHRTKLMLAVASILYVPLLSCAADSPGVVPGSPSSAKVSARPQGHSTKNKIGVRKLEGFQIRPRVIAFSSTGGVMACVEGEDKIWVWDLATDKLLRSIQIMPPTAEEKQAARTSSLILPDPNRIVALAFSPDGKTLAAGSAKIRVWSLKTGQLQRTLVLKGKEADQRTSTLAFSPDGKVLASGSPSGAARLWDTTTWNWRATLQEKGQYSIQSLAFASDSIRLACAGTKLSLWDVSRRVVLRNFQGMVYDLSALKGVVFSPDGKTLVAAGERTPYTEQWSLFDYGGFYGVMQVWDAQTGNLRKTVTFKDERVYSLAYAPDGQTLAVSYSDGTRLWNTQHWRLQQSLRGAPTDALSFFVGSKTLAMASENGGIKLWSPTGLNRILLGIAIREIGLTKAQRMASQLPHGIGVQIVSVAPSGIAAQNELRQGDIIVSIHGQAMDHPEVLSETIQSLGEGKSAVLGVLRENRMIQYRIKLGNES